MISDAIGRAYEEEVVNYLKKHGSFPRRNQVYYFGNKRYIVHEIRHNCFYVFKSKTHSFLISQLELLTKEHNRARCKT